MRILATLLLSLTTLFANAQFYQEDFGTATNCADLVIVPRVVGSGVTINDWRIYMTGTNSPDTTQRWMISAKEANMGLGNCGDGCMTSSSLNQTLYIGRKNTANVGVRATYDTDSATSMYVYAPNLDITATSGNVRVEFDYLEGGDGQLDNGYFVVAIGNNYTTPVYTLDLPKTDTGSSCATSGEWRHVVVYLDQTIGSNMNTQTQVGVGFYWINNADGNGGNPSFAVDNLTFYSSVPQAVIVASDTAICTGSSINFSSASEGDPTNYAWDFDNGSAINTNPNPGSIQFTTAGTYNITLTATNGIGSHDTVLTVNVYDCAPPEPAFLVTDDDLCQGQCISFTDISADGTFGKGDWVWQFGANVNPPVSTDQNPQNICFPIAGTYDITLTVTDTASGLDSTTVFPSAIFVDICQVPVAAFLSDTNKICNNDCIEFYSISTGDPDSIFWTFPGSNVSAVQGLAGDLDTITVCYTTPGIYDVTLRVKNEAGEDDTMSVAGLGTRITVMDCPTPQPKFTSNKRIVCPGLTVVFEDQSSYATSWYWQFPGGSPSTSNDQNPQQIQYDTPGKYPVILTVTNVNGDSTLTVESYITVDSCLIPDPRFELERDSICKGSCVQFFNTSLRADSIFWVFWMHPYPDRVGDTIFTRNAAGDTTDTFVVAKEYFPLHVTDSGVIDTIFMLDDPILCFNDSGTVSVQLFAVNEHGININNSQDVPVLSISGAHPTLKPGPDKHIRIDNIESRFYLEDTVRFEPVGSAPFYRWFPEDGLSCFDCPRPIIYPTYTRKYFITNYDAYGCQVYDSVIVFVDKSYYAGIPNIFSPNGDNLNDILWVRGNAISSDGFVMRIWDNNGAMVFESYSQNDGWDGSYKGVPAPLGVYNYYVKVTFHDGHVEELKGNVTLVRY